jgi:hypothetical protein
MNESNDTMQNTHQKFISYCLETGKLMRIWCCYVSLRGGTVIKVRCYKSEGRWFDSRWCRWNFSLT